MSCILPHKQAILNLSQDLSEKGATKPGIPWVVQDFSKTIVVIKEFEDSVRYYFPNEFDMSVAEIKKTETKLEWGSSYRRDNIKTTYRVIPNKQFLDKLDAKRKELGIYDSKLALSDYFEDLQEQYDIIDNKEIKPGVSELFESNPELANAVYEAAGFKSKADVILPIGTSGSGKSTFIKSLPQKNLVVIEPDAMRVEFTGNMNDKSKDKEIYEEAAKRAIAAIKQGKQVVFDTTNLTKDKRVPFIEAIKKEIPTANIQYKLMELNPELAKQRIKAQLARGENRAVVSDETIDRHAASYKQMLEDIKSESINNYEITPQQKQQALQLYSQYLDSIFPDSKVKDIVYHGRWDKKLDLDEYDGAYPISFTNVKEEANMWGTRMYRGYDNVNAEIVAAIINTNDSFQKVSYKNIFKSIEYKNLNAIDVNKAAVHILGSQQDIEGFKQFVGGKPIDSEFVSEIKESVQFIQEQILSPEMVEIIKNNHPQLQDGMTQLELDFMNRMPNKEC